MLFTGSYKPPISRGPKDQEGHSWSFYEESPPPHGKGHVHDDEIEEEAEDERMYWDDEDNDDEEDEEEEYGDEDDK
jgi:hypothetical protein